MNTKLLMSRRDTKIVELFASGIPCSRIDREMKLDEGVAHDAVVHWWYRDKMKAIEEAMKP